MLDSGGHEIVDYKSGKRGMTQGDLKKQLGLTDEAPRDFQLLIYFFGSKDGDVDGVTGVQPEVVGLWYPSQVMKKPPGIRKTQIVIEGPSAPGGVSKTSDPAALGPNELDAAHTRIIATIKEMRAGAYAPAPRHDGYTCLAAWGKGCDYAWVCPGRVEEPADYDAQ